MAAENLFPVIVIVGPTASGKTHVAICLAEAIGAEIISADSRQFYRDMDIGTAKPTAAELARVTHHFIDFLPPQVEFSAGEFSRIARDLIRELRRRGKNVIVAGGSGMYIRALLDGFFEPAIKDPAIKQALKQRAETEGGSVLYRELQAIDPVRAAELHPNDVHRIVRALEVYYASGKRFSEVQQQKRVAADFPFVQIGLRWPREKLYQRIEQRVDDMIRQGLERETRALLVGGVNPKANALQSVGYREMIQYIRGELAFAEMVDKIKQHTRNFAKRQLTWFRRDARIRWVEVHSEEELDRAAHQMLEIITQLQQQTLER